MWNYFEAENAQTVIVKLHRAMNESYSSCEKDRNSEYCEWARIFRKDFDELVDERNSYRFRTEIFLYLGLGIPLACMFLFLSGRWVVRGRTTPAQPNRIPQHPLSAVKEPMNKAARSTASSYKLDVNAEVDRLFGDPSSLNAEPPKAVILMGGVAAGKTHTRKEKYASGYVLIDAAEIFHHLSCGDATLDFPDALKEPLDLIGSLVAHRALSERRSIVTEIIGARAESVRELLDSLTALGYKIDVLAITCDVQEARHRNERRGDNISAYYAEPFQTKWIINASKELARQRNSVTP